MRSFAAAAAAQKQESQSSFKFHPREKTRTSSVDNITVSTVETNRPIAKLAIYFK